MMILYKTLVRPIIDYCVPVWKPYLQKDINKIGKIQNRYTKMIKGCNSKTYEQRLVTLGITSLADRHYRQYMIQVSKILNDSKSIFPSGFLISSVRMGSKK